MEPPEQRGQIVGDGLAADGPVAQRGTAVALQVDRDHLALGGEARQHRLEHVAAAEAPWSISSGSPLPLIW
jgi:hypothetical protein